MITPMMPDETVARELLRQIGMDVPADRIRRVQGGTVNSAFKVDQGSDGTFVLRISPSDAEAEAGPSWFNSHGLRREQTTIGLLSDIAYLLPRTIHFDESRQHIDRDWVLQTWVEGEAWAKISPTLTAAENLQLWRDMGQITRQMHAIVRDEFGPPEAGLGYTTWSDLIRWDVTGFVVDAQRYGIQLAPFNRLQDLVDWAAPILNRVTEARLIHSDLNQRHIFISRDDDDRPRITGLIDFEFARFADPYSESIFVDEALLPSDDGRGDAFCEGYQCNRPTHDDMVCRRIYSMLAVGWIVTDLARKNEHEKIAYMLDRMQALLDSLRYVK